VTVQVVVEMEVQPEIAVLPLYAVYEVAPLTVFQLRTTLPLDVTSLSVGAAGGLVVYEMDADPFAGVD